MNLPGFLSKVEWPPYSPDLNVIEWMCAIMNAAVLAKAPATQAALVECCINIDAWYGVPQSTICSFYDSWNARCSVCVDIGGMAVDSKIHKPK